MKASVLCWGGMALLLLASGCTPSSGDSAAAANADAVDKRGVPPVVRADARDVPATSASAPAIPVAAASSAKPAPPVEADQPLDLPPSNAAANATPFPAEVTAFMVDRDGCDHFRGEEPYDAERAAYLEQSIRELCTGTDAKLARLRKRYAEDADVIAALGNYEDRIEAHAKP